MNASTCKQALGFGILLLSIIIAATLTLGLLLGLDVLIGIF